MEKNFVLRIFLITSFLVFLILIFFKFTNKEQSIKQEVEKIEEKIESSNLIKDVSYTSKDPKGNQYSLNASEGIIDVNNNNYIFLTSVKAIINLHNYSLIEISSDFGKYNIDNYDTIFSKNVIITYLDNKIKGEYLDFSLEKNLLIISKGVILKNNKNSLKADVVEMNIKTKDVKIFMYEENKKINIKSLN
mgnify:CR=1 FL=1